MLDSAYHDRLRDLPAVHRLLAHPLCLDAQARWSSAFVSAAAAELLARVRADLQDGKQVAPWTIDSLALEVQLLAADKFRPHLRKVVNATGIVLHTYLGRAPLARSALDEIQQIAAGYSNLELDLATGERGSRYSHVEQILCKLTGAESALVVNNNAAAVFLILRELANEQEVIVSRGQLVEIGGSFRVSEVMRESGAKLVEVGTTNKTHLRDYEQAITDQTSLVMRVHTSNFRIVGFTGQPSLSELVHTVHQHGIPVYEDLGSGSILDLRQHGIGDEPHVRASVEAGADIVSFSGDKMLGGGQAGIIVGKEAFITRLRQNQLTRALRIDKLTLAALEATLLLYQDEATALREIPALRMLTESVQSIKDRADSIVSRLAAVFGQQASLELMDSVAYVGGGSLPNDALPSCAIALRMNGISADKLEQRLREQLVPVLAIIRKEAVLFDIRTLFESDIEFFIESIISAVHSFR
ncbi:MAG: L-seryl-tRNA(Sec) selenium transferase [Bacilli bacterium]|nr:L-seryl-tRNA(Sec) selenium transferase [Bacilli bacterium]